jgi:hypothetical protein
MKINSILLVIFSAVAGNSVGQNVIVPETKITDLVITDGNFDMTEWKNATRTELSKKDSVYLLLKNHKNHIVLGIQFPFKMLAYIDMFIDFGDGQVHHFHSSAQIGERILTDTTWTDDVPPIHWGNAVGWYANEMRNDKTKAAELLKEDPNRNRDRMLLETTYPLDGYEYIFNKKSFSSKKWKVRIEVRTAMPGFSTIVYPVNSTRKNSANWMLINFK